MSERARAGESTHKSKHGDTRHFHSVECQALNVHEVSPVHQATPDTTAWLPSSRTVIPIADTKTASRYERCRPVDRLRSTYSTLLGADLHRAAFTRGNGR